MMRWLLAKEFYGMGLLVVCLLLAGTAGCGSPASDKPVKVESSATNGKPEDRTGAVQRRAEKFGQDNPAPTKGIGSAGAMPSLTEIPRDADDRLNIPETVAKDLGSPNARERYRALEYWEEQGSKAPMDPVFDALEDDDPAVRAKAAAIVERYTEAGEERE